MRFAGAVVLTSALLSIYHHPYWLGLTLFAGFNMLQASFTGFCPVAKLFRKLGIRPGSTFN
jgi:hypothetical protein